MKYKTPKYEMVVIEAEDILTASPEQTSKYEVEQNGDGSGKVTINASNLF